MSDQFAVGMTAQISKSVTERDLLLMAEVTGDTNPLHLDETFAQKTRFGGRIAHGMLAAGLISAVLGTKLPGPGAIYMSQSLKFVRPVRIGDTITAVVTVTDWDPEKRNIQLKTTVENHRGKMVLAGEAQMLVEELTANG